jgi:hypothetical protein
MNNYEADKTKFKATVMEMIKKAMDAIFEGYDASMAD